MGALLLWIFALSHWALCTQISLHDNLPPSKTPFDVKFNKTANNLLRSLHIPGFSIAVVHGPQTYAAGYGIATFPDIPATPDTLYHPGSTTKAFTAAAVALLVDNSSIDWNTPISSVIRDDFVLSDDWATTHITVEDALSHRTGLPRHDLVYGDDKGTPQSIVRNLRHLPLTAEPRTRWQYCNVMFTTVGYVVERVSGSLLGDFMRERIWEPLDMTSTYSSLSDALKSPQHFATGYDWRNDTQSFQALPYTEVDQIGGAGFLISTVNDYVKWIRSMIYQAPPLSKSGHAAVILPRIIQNPNDETMWRWGYVGDRTYALGWDRYVYRGHLVISHSGSIRGFGAQVLYAPELEWGAVVMGNSQMPMVAAEAMISFGLLDDLLSVPQDERFDYLELYHNQTAEASRALKTAEQRLYPNVPSPRLPKTLPLAAYAGEYHHTAYGTVSCQVNGTGLSAKLDKNLLAYELLLTHVSGEFWLATLSDWYTRDVSEKIKAEFKLDEQGNATKLGIELDGELAKQGGKIWFSRAK